MKALAGSWTQTDGGNTVTNGKTVLAIGDYVNYTYDTASPYQLSTALSGYTDSQTISQTTGLKWRVLGVDESGRLTLISDVPVKDKTLYFRDATGYNNGVYLLNDICAKQYSNQKLGITARSLNLEDIEGGLNDTGKAERNKYTQSNSGMIYGDTKGYTDNRQYPILYVQENGSGIDSETTKTKGTGRSDAYYTEAQLTAKPEGKETDSASSKLNCTQTHYSFSSTPSYCNNTTFHTMIFGTGTFYWLASRYVDCYSNLAHFGLCCVGGAKLSGSGLFISSGIAYNNNYGYALRPVVSLGSNVKVTACTGTNSDSNMHQIEKAS